MSSMKIMQKEYYEYNFMVKMHSYNKEIYNKPQIAIS